MNDPLAQKAASDGKTSGGIRVKILLGIFGLFWCSLVGAFDYTTIRYLIPQIASTWFKPTSAHIEKCEVRSHSDSEGGMTHSVAVQYNYSVDGVNYAGDRYTFDKSSSSDGGWAREAVIAFPAGSERTCYYDPHDPARAVLAPGIHGSDITRLMFLTPFNIIAVFLVGLPIWIWLDRRRPTMVQPRVSDIRRGREAYAMKRYNPVVTFLGLFLMTSFLGIFAVVFPAGFHPTIARVCSIWGTAFVIALGITIYAHFKTKTGRYDLVLDYNSRSITIPPMHQRNTAEIIPMSEVTLFDAAKVETGSGDDRKTTWQVKLVDRTNREVVVHESYLEPDAKRLADTLNAKLKS